MTTPDKEEMPTEDRTAGDFWAEKRDGRWQLQMRHRGPGSSFCVAQINHWADNPEALTTRIADACNAYEPMREALSKIANCGQSQEPDHWQFRVMARDTSNAALSTLPVNDRHHSGSDDDRLREALALVLPMAKGYAHEHPVGDNYGKCQEAEAVLNSTDRQTSDDVGRLREALEATTGEIERNLNDHLNTVCVVRDDVPDRSTMEPEDAEETARLEEVISRARAALKGVPAASTPEFNPPLRRARRPELTGGDGLASQWTGVGCSDLADTLREIEKQCIQADDPEHHTLSLVKYLARHALARLPQPASEAGKLSSEAES